MRAFARIFAAASLAAVTPATAAAAETADPKAAAAAFESLCLANAGSAAAVRAAAPAAAFAQGPTLPELQRGQGAFEGYTKGPLELVLREAKSGSFGCILLFPPDEAAGNASVAAAVTALSGVALKSSGGGAKSWRAKWTPLTAPKGSEVVLTIHGGTGRRIAILALESKAKK